MRLALCLAQRLKLHRLPQLKGKGKVIGADAHDEAASRLAVSFIERPTEGA